jgi:hypothetical protein
MRTRQTAAQSFATFSIRDLVSFMAGPPQTDFERSRSFWAIWEEFDETYRIVREEYLASASEFMAPGRTPFAEARYLGRCRA